MEFLFPTPDLRDEVRCSYDTSDYRVRFEHEDAVKESAYLVDRFTTLRSDAVVAQQHTPNLKEHSRTKIGRLRLYRNPLW